MRMLIPLAVSALALTACYPEGSGVRSQDGADRPAARTLARLTCPERSGELVRIAASADGRTCSYTAPNGGEVGLRLVALSGQGLPAAMAPIETELRAIVPPPSTRPVAAVPAAGRHDDVAIDLPFFEVRAGEDSARVRMPGVSVDANGDDATVNVGSPNGETVQVNARGGASEVRVNGGGRRDDLRATYILSAEQPTREGWRLAGYQARGPRAGPLVVAVARSRSDSDMLFEDLEALIDHSFEARAAAAEARAEAVEARAEAAAARTEAQAEAAAAREEAAAERAAAQAEAAAERAAQAVERAVER